MVKDLFYLRFGKHNSRGVVFFLPLYQKNVFDNYLSALKNNRAVVINLLSIVLVLGILTLNPV